MKWLKSTSILLLAMTLAACGYGFEGEYQSEAGSSIELMDVFAEVAGSQKFVIGKNFIDS